MVVERALERVVEIVVERAALTVVAVTPTWFQGAAGNSRLRLAEWSLE
jgi:hypothetical protein